MSRPDSPQPSQQRPMEMPMGEWLRSLAIQRARGTGSTPRTRPLWSTLLPPLGLGDSLVVELLPTLALRVRNVETGEVLITTEPVDFGPLACTGQSGEQRDSGQALADKFYRWCEERRADAGNPASRLVGPSRLLMLCHRLANPSAERPRKASLSQPRAAGEAA